MKTQRQNDIAERLRAGTGDGLQAWDWVREAADEIERLRAALQKVGLVQPNSPNLDRNKVEPYDPTTQPFDEPLRHVDTQSRIPDEYTQSRIAIAPLDESELTELLGDFIDDEMGATVERERLGAGDLHMWCADANRGINVSELARRVLAAGAPSAGGAAGYLLFVGDDYCPVGGADDLVGRFATIEDAVAAIPKLECTYGWAQVLDLSTLCQALVVRDKKENRWTVDGNWEPTGKAPRPLRAGGAA